MGILSRFTDIISANVNALLDKAEDPGKLADEFLRKANDELLQVKRETAMVMAEESRARRMVDENEREIARYSELARKAVLAGNDGDAKVFIGKKQKFEAAGVGLNLTLAAASENAAKMRQMHDKLDEDIRALNAKRQMIKTKTAVAAATNRIAELQPSGRGEAAIGAFERMEAKADRLLDEANARAALDYGQIDDAKELEKKYAKDGANDSVEAELAALKAQIANTP